MKKFVVVNPTTMRYLVSKTCRDYDKRIDGGNLEDARIFNTRSAARQAANRWSSVKDVDVVDIDISLAAETPLSKPTITSDFFGVGVLKFKDVNHYYRTYYSVNLVGHKPETYRVNAYVIDFLESNNRFLRSLSNGDNILIAEKDFENANPLTRLIAKSIIDELGVENPTGRFCLFEIDWKDENGKINSDY